MHVLYLCAYVCCAWTQCFFFLKILSIFNTHGEMIEDFKEIDSDVYIVRFQKLRYLCIQNSNMYCQQTMIKTMYLEVFQSCSKLCILCKVGIELMQKRLMHFSLARSIEAQARSIESRAECFFLQISNSALVV